MGTRINQITGQTSRGGDPVWGAGNRRARITRVEQMPTDTVLLVHTLRIKACVQHRWHVHERSSSVTGQTNPSQVLFASSPAQLWLHPYASSSQIAAKGEYYVYLP